MASMKAVLHLFPIILVKYCVLSLVNNSAFLDKVYNGDEYFNSECVKKLITDHQCGIHITIVVPDTNFQNFIKINSSCYDYVVITYEPVELLFNTNLYLIYYKINKTGPSIWKLRYKKYWNPNANFLFVTTSEVQYPELKQIFSKLLKYYIFNVTVLTQINKTQGSWTFYPLKDGNCRSNYDKLEYLGRCVNNDIFPVAKDLTNCTILVTGNKIVDKTSYINYIQYLEAFLIKVSSQAIGVKIKFSFEDYDTNDGEVLSNYTSIGMLNYLQKRKADIVFGGFFLTEGRALIYDFVSGYKYTSIKLLVPNLGPKRWKIFYRIFRIRSWSLTACAFISMTMLTMAFSYYCFQIKDISRIPFHLIDYFFGHSDRKLFKVKKLRIILISWIFFTFFIASFYNSEIFSLLTKPGYDQQSSSIDELKQNGYTACMSDSIRAYTEIVYNITQPDEQVPECKNTEDVLNTITTRENYYTIADYSQYHNNLCHYNTRFDETAMLNNIIYVLYINKGFFLKEKFKRVVSAIFESGIIQDSHIYSVISKVCAKQPHHSEQIYEVLSLHDLQLIFCILLTGYFISLVVFLVECISRKYTS